MELYDKTSSAMSRLLTRQYSSSFSTASLLFPADIQVHIYNIYGLVRLADEIVDTYTGKDSLTLLDGLERETYRAIDRSFSTNPVVHAFQLTANKNDIGSDLLSPFFTSMRTDITAHRHTALSYKEYIFGSAEVVGLMCLKVFVKGDTAQYDQLSDSAAKLGAAYQKINFLRDLADDHTDLGRFYFPGDTFESFSDASKHKIIADIRSDLTAAHAGIRALPTSVRPAVATSYRYYKALLDKLETTPVDVIKQKRIRIPSYRKMLLLALSATRERR